ncbi:MAG: class I SAM-dependent methyltransferase [Planctomycetes bacterium]|nr:class I SAM-dependent methyltransferase [Planctomycetota bacterium]
MNEASNINEVWKQAKVAAAFLNERSLSIPDRPRQLDVLLRVLRRDSPGRFLDLGCGDGLLLATVLEAFPSSTGEALDFSPPMLEQARHRLSTFGARARVVEADLQSPDWRNSVSGPYDAVVSGFAIHHLTDGRKRALYAEILELLTPGGAFVNCEHVSSPSAGIEKLFDDAMADHLWQRRTQRGETVTRDQVLHEFLTRPDRAANICAPVEAQCQWLRDVGYREVDCFWKYFELAIFGGRKTN